MISLRGAPPGNSPKPAGRLSGTDIQQHVNHTSEFPVCSTKHKSHGFVTGRGRFCYTIGCRNGQLGDRRKSLSHWLVLPSGKSVRDVGQILTKNGWKSKLATNGNRPKH